MYKRNYIVLITAFLLVSCGPPKTLYTWGGKKYAYSKTSYKYLKASNEETSERLTKTYEKIINDQKGTRKVPPPGILADYGFLLLQQNKTEEGKQMLMKEIELYPESEIFITRILKMIGE
ncbi:MAG: DUF4810 domain-containing protein [Bacteroidota bacterium]|nr:DUF4810 domain-containing protein [Bacteroidota bacterium]